MSQSTLKIMTRKIQTGLLGLGLGCVGNANYNDPSLLAKG